MPRRSILRLRGCSSEDDDEEEEEEEEEPTTLTAGESTDASGDGGAVLVTAGAGTGDGSTSGDGGAVTIAAGGSANSTGGAISMTSGGEPKPVTRTDEDGRYLLRGVASDVELVVKTQSDDHQPDVAIWSAVRKDETKSPIVGKSQIRTRAKAVR